MRHFCNVMLVVVMIGVTTLIGLSVGETWKLNASEPAYITTSEFRAAQDINGDWRITSMDQETYESEDFLGASRAGRLSSLVIGRTGVMWDKKPIMNGPLWYIPPGFDDRVDDIVTDVFVRVKTLMKRIDAVYPDENVAFTFFVDFMEVVIYLQPDYWDGREKNAEIAEKLNENRTYEPIESISATDTMTETEC